MSKRSQPSKRIAITTTSFAEYDRTPLSILKKNGFEVIQNGLKRKLKADEIQNICRGCAGIIAGTETYDHGLLERLPDLKVISRCGVGTDEIDMKAAKDLGIKVLNTPDAPALAVAELTVGLILDMLRMTSYMDRQIRSGVWQKKMGNLLSRKRVGIIGFGRIGRKVTALLKAFDCEIAYCDPFVKNSRLGARRMGLDELLKWSDIISIHVSGKDRIINTRELSLMKNGSWIVNASRGWAIDQEALYEELSSGHIAGAALDVFSDEPYKGSLKELDNVVLTPHIGSYAKESRIEMEIQSVQNLIKGLERLK